MAELLFTEAVKSTLVAELSVRAGLAKPPRSENITVRTNYSAAAQGSAVVTNTTPPVYIGLDINCTINGPQATADMLVFRLQQITNNYGQFQSRLRSQVLADVALNSSLQQTMSAQLLVGVALLCRAPR